MFPASYPMHSTLDLPAEFNLTYIEPVFYTGLEISRSPHAPVVVAGIGLSVLGLLLLFGYRYNVLRGKLDSAGMLIKGQYLKTGARGMQKSIEDELHDLLAAYREGGIDGNWN
ncbi:MAG: hypothetical protein GF417_11460 [Candidatus Latescibacteria bacterium]|nr:hypothetical protein [bacterium]MBD3425041.1 hypothetical protein [Candidatus Latescibacterota bacterium]